MCRKLAKGCEAAEAGTYCSASTRCSRLIRFWKEGSRRQLEPRSMTQEAREGTSYRQVTRVVVGSLGGGIFFSRGFRTSPMVFFSRLLLEILLIDRRL